MNIRHAFVIAATAAIVWAAQAADKPKVMTAEEMAAADGGLIVRPGTPKGKIAIIDTQSRFAEASIKEVIGKLVKNGQYNIVYEKAAPAACPCTLKEASKADLAIVIADDAKKPTSVVSPDDHWAMMNVAKLDIGLKTESAKAKFFEGRCRRQLMRIYAIAAGSWTSQYRGNILAADKLQNIDLSREELPMDARIRSDNYLPLIGITKKEVDTYYNACYNGWAPAPTNDVQKEIWKEFHDEQERGPKNALKIVPPKKK